MNLAVGQKVKVKTLSRMDYGRVFEAIIEEIETSDPKPVYIGGRRIGTPLHPKGKLFHLKEIHPDGSFAPTACYHERHLRIADENGNWWCV